MPSKSEKNTKTYPAALTAVVERFSQWSAQKPSLFSAPARINLIGEHTDYNLGFVLPAAIDRHIYFAIAAHNLPEFLIDAFDLKETVRLPIANNHLPQTLWAKYFYGIIQVLRSKGLTVPPVACVFGGTIPIGSGLSSSSALTGGFIFALNELFDWNLSRLDIAKLAQAAEHQVGLNCGIMDQYTILHGQKGQVLQLDCLHLSHQYFPLELGDYRLVLFNSMVSHSLADSAYNDRRQSCETVLHLIQQKNPEVQSLRDVDEDMLEQFKPELPPLAHQRVNFVLQENKRVIQTTEALNAGQLEQVGQYLYASHKGLSKVYEVSCEELDFLVETIRGQTGVLGSRMMGGGFGGCTINIIHQDEIENIAEQLRSAYQKTYGKTPEMHVVQTSEGVSRVV